MPIKTTEVNTVNDKTENNEEKKFSVKMVNTRSNKDQTIGEKFAKKDSALVTEVELETPEQSTDEVERNTAESKAIPNVDEQGTKTIEFSPIGNGNEITGNTPEKIKDDSQTKRTSFTERFAAMVAMKPNNTEDATWGATKIQIK